MASKRSRIVRPLDWQPPLQKGPQKMKKVEKVAPPQPCRSIFRLNSPGLEDDGVVSKNQPDEGSRAFLKCCSLCKKELRADKDVFMYGNLTAFCSTECRDHQMAVDGFNRKAAADMEARKTAVLAAQKEKQ